MNEARPKKWDPREIPPDDFYDSGFDKTKEREVGGGWMIGEDEAVSEEEAVSVGADEAAAVGRRLQPEPVHNQRL